MEDIARFYSMLAVNGPMFAAALIGIVIALVMWSKAPLPAKLVLIACVLEMLLACFSTWLSGWYVPHLASEGHTMRNIGVMVAAVSLCASVLRAVLFGLLIWAAFADRHPAVSTAR